jgi:hypothetical protein
MKNINEELKRVEEDKHRTEQKIPVKIATSFNKTVERIDKNGQVVSTRNFKA